jgi:hypothetical protein
MITRIRWHGTSTVIAIALVATLSPCTAATGPDAPIDWQKAAVGDIEAAYRITAAEHPGMVDKSNPNFAKLLERARSDALALAARVTTAGGYDAVMSRFKSVLNDGHAGTYAAVPDKIATPVQWPGFVAAWRGNAMFVYKAAPGGPAEGARITGCDGTPIKTLIERNVFAYRHGRQSLGDWWAYARLTLIDRGNPFIARAVACTFETAGKATTQTLKWGPLPDYYQSWKDGSANGDRLPVGITERAPGLFWVAMPTFQPDEGERAAYKAINAAITAKRASLLKARAIVLDLRFNQGGSSTWSNNLAALLWGQPRYDRVRGAYDAAVRTWWRPTDANEKMLRAYAGMSRQQGDSEAETFMIALANRFATARAIGGPFVVEEDAVVPERPERPPENLPGDPAALTTPVYVIVPGQCASACLDAVDYFKLFPNTVLIGAPSSSDSTYMDVRSELLPSGMGGVIIPMKMYVNRPRGNGVFYRPDIEMTDFDWSTESFQRRIETDLKTRYRKSL